MALTGVMEFGRFAQALWPVEMVNSGRKLVYKGPSTLEDRIPVLPHVFAMHVCASAVTPTIAELPCS